MTRRSSQRMRPVRHLPPSSVQPEPLNLSHSQQASIRRLTSGQSSSSMPVPRSYRTLSVVRPMSGDLHLRRGGVFDGRLNCHWQASHCQVKSSSCRNTQFTVQHRLYMLRRRSHTATQNLCGSLPRKGRRDCKDQPRLPRRGNFPGK